jgi:hypothetical protein
LLKNIKGDRDRPKAKKGRKISAQTRGKIEKVHRVHLGKKSREKHWPMGGIEAAE